jgi:acyl-coenzyme A thioesterase PaaI-like protein
VPDARRLLADSIRRLTAQVVATVSSDPDLVAAAAAVDRVTDTLAAAQPPARARAVPGDVAALPESYFPISPIIGAHNPVAPPVAMELAEGGARGHGRFGAPYQGPPGFVHGGVVALVLDELLGVANIAAGTGAMTGTLTVRYRRPTPLHTDLALAATSQPGQGRKVHARGEITTAAGEVTAEAEGLFVVLDSRRRGELFGG